MEKFNKLKYDMRMHFQAEYPREACGIITNDFKYIPCKNISSTPANSFILDPVALWEHEEDAWGICHSHPGDENPLPSEDDIASTVFNTYKFIVGFAGIFYIYWYDFDKEILMYETFEEKHIA